MSDSIIERLRHHAKDERNTAFARSTMREAELEIEQQRLSEEGAKDAFAHVVQQKRDLETECKRLGGLLDDAYKIIRHKERELAASREREARMRGALRNLLALDADHQRGADDEDVCAEVSEARRLCAPCCTNHGSTRRCT